VARPRTKNKVGSATDKTVTVQATGRVIPLEESARVHQRQVETIEGRDACVTG
jgi:hypothetical protein